MDEIKDNELTELTEEEKMRIMEAQMMAEEEKFMRRGRLIDILITATLAVFILPFLITMICLIVPDKADENTEYTAQVEKLTYKKQQLLTELNALAPAAEKRLGNTSYMSFVFTGLDEMLYTTVYPIMVEGNVDLVGVLAFSPNELPGQEGKITMEQYDTLMLLSWGTAIYWDGSTDLNEYLSTMQTLLDEKGIPFPKSMVFKSGYYRVSYDEVIAAYGIKNAIHNGEEGLSVRETTEPKEMWHPGVIGWKAGTTANKLKRTIEDEGGYALFEINFNNAKDNSACTFIPLEGEGQNARVESFKTMANLFKTSISNGDIEVLSIDTVRAKVERYYGEMTVEERANEERRKAIDEEIAEIERQITDLYYQYNKGD